MNSCPAGIGIDGELPSGKQVAERTRPAGKKVIFGFKNCPPEGPVPARTRGGSRLRDSQGRVSPGDSCDRPATRSTGAPFA